MKTNETTRIASVQIRPIMIQALVPKYFFAINVV